MGAGGCGGKEGVCWDRATRNGRESSGWGVGKVRGRRKVGGKKKRHTKKPPSKFDIARIIVDEVP
jgi:hypothetical protein